MTSRNGSTYPEFAALSRFVIPKSLPCWPRIQFMWSSDVKLHSSAWEPCGSPHMRQSFSNFDHQTGSGSVELQSRANVDSCSVSLSSHHLISFVIHWLCSNQW
ncbi:hypothetical protein VNO77_27319 [Canavalia gladiata]|uniref:Uncharacterized protein n=1 Tax=Canavalia gladiata TaxID=3824 RepID=A0AAN9Q6Z8_CANGL